MRFDRLMHTVLGAKLFAILDLVLSVIKLIFAGVMRGKDPDWDGHLDKDIFDINRLLVPYIFPDAFLSAIFGVLLLYGLKHKRSRFLLAYTFGQVCTRNYLVNFKQILKLFYTKLYSIIVMLIIILSLT